MSDYDFFGDSNFRGYWIIDCLGLASELLAKGSEVLEHKFGAGFTGSVVLGFITMLPELIFVLVAVNEVSKFTNPVKQEELLDIALGSAVGGNILLFTLGYGMVILFSYYKHKEIIKLPATLKDDLIFLLVASVYLLLTSLKGYFNMFDGIILFMLYVIFVAWQYIETKKIVDIHEGTSDEGISRKQWNKSILFLVIGGVVLLLVAEPFVHVIIGISDKTGVPAIILAIVISPMASELPEKIFAFVLTSRSLAGAKIAVANFIGSKVQASTLLFGSMIIYKIILTGSNFEVGNNFIQIMLAVLTTIVGVWITYDLKLKLKEGWFVLVLYFITIAIAIQSIR